MGLKSMPTSTKDILGIEVAAIIALQQTQDGIIPHSHRSSL